MIGLDTNVIVRLLTEDDPIQLKAAKRLLTAHEGEPGAFFVNDIVLVEVVWVLRRLFGFEPAQALVAVESLLASDAYAFEDRALVVQAHAACSKRGYEFADTLVSLKNASRGCKHTATFDKAMRDLPAVRVL
ncbi:MAG: type II toxin-antitoxin system VapC family toxin [Gammaproteobacteria bacterium]|nr:type II toxin-antitoxin system VapC family toxin [Gammaproteobacteria bacterium]